ncbi:MAG: hypothetical protein JWM10_3749 [Myxococcaceae bacterium]|nr:hypothetical protein [Myxococcaceae bacterium]
MDHPPNVCTIEVDLDRVLWLTRGRRWSYAFLLKPLISPGDSWMSIQARIFDGVKPSVSPYSVAGKAVEAVFERAFIATAFVDPVRRDEWGRDVVHHLVWFPPDERAARMVAPADWGPRLVDALAPAYDAAFAVDLADRGDERDLDPIAEVRDAFERERDRLPPRVVLSGRAVMLYALQAFETKRVVLPQTRPRPRHTAGRALFVWVAAFGALLLLALALRRCS